MVTAEVSRESRTAAQPAVRVAGPLSGRVGPPESSKINKSDLGRSSSAAAEEFWRWFDGDQTNRYDRTRQAPPRAAPPTVITGSGQRKQPTAKKRKAILVRQKNRCLYCEHTLGTEILRRGDPVALRLNWDHFVPYAYGRTNAADNWVAACHVCNGIKSGRMFETVAEAQRYILGQWPSRGYQVRPPTFSSLLRETA